MTAPTKADRIMIRLRELTDAVRRLENRKTYVIGGYRLEDIDGDLVATHISTGHRTALVKW